MSLSFPLESDFHICNNNTLYETECDLIIQKTGPAAIEDNIPSEI
jgi:hypothetical protein